MKSKKEVKEYLQELKEQYDNWENPKKYYDADFLEIDAEEAQIVEIQIETLEWVLK